MHDQEAQHDPSNDDFLANCGLDAYGHLEWTVGNEDWLACFDAVLSPEKERIAYHIVVDCESGGFTDTPESGVIRVDDENAIKSLGAAPLYWADICSEHYINEPDMAPVYEETEACAKRWQAHLAGLVKQAIDAE